MSDETSSGRRTPSITGVEPRLSRRAIAGGLASLAALTAARPALAEQAFWQGIPGFGGGDAPVRERRPPPDPLEDLRPTRVPYRSEEMLEAMDVAFARYQKIASRGGWPTIEGTRMIRPGDDDQRVPALRRRLALEGYMRRSGSFDSFTHDGDVEQAVKRFQESHGLRPSGRVDRPTIEELNVTAEARLNQLRLNAQRMQELLQQRPEDRYILVNVPAFQLEAVERHDVHLRHRVIVGRSGRETPNIRATIRAVNFFPHWRVPDSIARLDLVPRMRKEPDFLEKERIRLFQGFGGPELDTRTFQWATFDTSRHKFKQDPGPQNALGLVRIDMINEHGVYMHDTPMKELFRQRARNFSAGCVRVEDVFQLVEWIARYEPGWEAPGRAEQVLQAGAAHDVTLTRPLPVYFTYITAWAEPGGRVEFRPDIYNRDNVYAGQSGAEHDPDSPPVPVSSQALAP
jgi:murein L,D-transpeptidase YcbB/YkuD